MTKWETHKEIMPLNPDEIQRTCDRAGQDGWQVAGTMMLMLASAPQIVNGIIQPGNQQIPGILVLFQRPIAPASEVAETLLESVEQGSGV